ncbi:lytic polysaccharide monooxygenase [Xylona heveae TC161]|uniref:AA9 family lytic polysaccharide monooxygenase n=1 Tax=Xylona heveae (strain CBS 132557 / TC161) TaxID=1328760 RepID=A0A164ZP00_XYLHT|nr:lytic polysaccharide monooxygenase [Xylona heveae TC161]KZF19328.1 lytic polysaccharide monooxygenase [Xylona heveae TC161]
MKLLSGKSIALAALAGLQAVHAHTLFTNFYVDGENQGNGVCVREPNDPSKANFPIEDLSSNDMACGFNGETPVSRVCPINGSATLSFEFRQYPDGSKPGSIDPSHKGPCAVYMKKVESAIHDPGYGDGWFKIWDDGYDESSNQWCTEKLIANNGHLTVQVPSDLAGGYYLVRPELLALHAADKGDPQFYIGCAQVFLQSSATGTRSDTVSIPGYVHAGDRSVSFNIWQQPMDLPYPIPGPNVSRPDSGSPTTAVTTQTEGLKPEGCVLENANWCGMEIAPYSDMQGCWNASQACWDQNSACYKAAPPSGYANCEVWQNKCKNIQNQCSANNYNGPPDAGKDLTPQPASASLPPPANAGYPDVGGSSSAAAAPSSSSSPATSSSSFSSAVATSSATPTSESSSSSPASSSSSSSSANVQAQQTTQATAAGSSSASTGVPPIATDTVYTSSNGPSSTVYVTDSPTSTPSANAGYGNGDVVTETETVNETTIVTQTDYVTATATATPGASNNKRNVHQAVHVPVGPVHRHW